MKLVIVDRDGTICVEREGYIQTPDDWEPLPGALDAIARINQAGYHVVIAANLPGLGRGLFDMAALNAIQAKMNKQLAAVGGRVEAIFYCPHAPDEGCTCRKPLPGLFQQIGERYKVDLRNIHAVGDSVRDVQAAAAAGCIPHLVLTGKGAPVQTDPLPPEFPPGTRVHADLAAFATAFVAEVEAQQAAARAEADAKADRTAPAPLR
ncbi:D-glycero-beta-D-manno-heptose 1,7-bisphosphate 7-phosphatase [Ottowia beijingensis]|jgi:D-glycero-D-manno-heptose 1,7-bisphosphate phosphatase|uniref:D-glycero-beta-D-manno-heptose-1,7-bisphosphate 7-phosphatase n=1 Tax=Ottowia beijingensis TaxID=1207057 RepID=A0A853ISU3_9BURK|nr:D-glycero-beta-D-manno-heptose 1,7-bisphosphate 7-phosphatase [Ottowia beijingensis]MBP9954019.1 D-glycero-beta-D-manno-heptose 1,7-bisphosphate 7-phosphatase [Ottowia sp.]NZA02065.1 D-glycero-beta-D-manno-heptose 1,7-bisphosphate 7-phosphatase [Ottowia beijingensis]